jgi:hypothetical protein
MSVTTEQIETARGHHAVYFYDGEHDLSRFVAAYLAPGLRNGAVAVVIATEDHYRALEAALDGLGVAAPEARDRGRLMWLDATDILERISAQESVDAAAFEREVAAVIRRWAEPPGSLLAYGELVDLLWIRGDVAAAIELERLWNGLIEELEFPLLCAYRGSGMGDPGYHEHIRKICQLHASISSSRRLPRRDPEPGLEVSRLFAPGRDAPGAARRFLEDALRQWGRLSLLDDARVVLSELVTNAVLHARSPFTVSVRAEESGVRLAVHDDSPAQPPASVPRPPATAAHGLQLVSALSSSWGVERVGHGKIVWASVAPRLVAAS